MKKIIIIALFVIFLAGCQSTTHEEMMEDEMERRAMEEMGMIEGMMVETDMPDEWRDVELKDVSTGETFRISDFSDKTVVIESFAVWCPTCKRQQDKIKELHEIIGDDTVSISLNTDPNEDEGKVIGHVNRHGYDWRFAVAPIELTKALIEEFGIAIVNAPGAPVALVCGDGSSRLLARGVKSADKLKSEIEKGC